MGSFYFKRTIERNLLNKRSSLEAVFVLTISLDCGLKML